MKWLPSFMKLFLTFVVGFVLQLGAGIAEMETLGKHPLMEIFGGLQLLGLLLLVVSPVLMGLNFLPDWIVKPSKLRQPSFPSRHHAGAVPGRKAGYSFTMRRTSSPPSVLARST